MCPTIRTIHLMSDTIDKSDMINKCARNQCSVSVPNAFCDKNEPRTKGHKKEDVFQKRYSYTSHTSAHFPSSFANYKKIHLLIVDKTKSKGNT